MRWSGSVAALVVGQPRLPGWGSWIRSVAHQVMRQTRCPVIIAPPGPSSSKRTTGLSRRDPDLTWRYEASPRPSLNQPRFPPASAPDCAESFSSWSTPVKEAELPRTVERGPPSRSGQARTADQQAGGLVQNLYHFVGLLEEAWDSINGDMPSYHRPAGARVRPDPRRGRWSLRVSSEGL
jgi:hypothetical protein